MTKTDAQRERNWVLLWAVAIVLLASVPYFWGLAITPEGHSFLGLTYNIDDGAVYLSWMRQAADGHFFTRDLFTNQAPPGRQFNVLFLLMGNLSAITCIPLIWMFHVFRVLLGVGLIFAVWQFSKLFIEEPGARRLLIPLVGLSAGVGWLIPGAQMPTGSVDVWQPEAITFLSIYLNPLFLAGLILMLGSLYFLTLAHRTGRATYAAYAGVSLLLLGNIHTYDVLTVTCVWVAYLVVLAVVERRFPVRTVLLSALAALIAVPSVAYQFYLFQTDQIFRARANTPINSPPIWSFFAGYGLVLLGAVVGAVMSIAAARRTRSFNIQHSTFNSLLLIVWSIVGFAIPYIPIAQQRKLIMGLHIPLCILCAYALSHLLARAPRSVARGLTLAFILFASGSTVSFLSRDINLLMVGDTAPNYSPFISSQELSAMCYLRENMTSADTVFAPPSFALFTPAFTGRQVYYGHWSETPDYGQKRSWWAAFVARRTPTGLRTAILRETDASYYVSVNDLTLPPPDFAQAHLERGFAAGPVEVLRVGR